VWQNVNPAGVEAWAEGLFDRAAEVLGKPINGLVVDRMNETLLVRGR